MPFRHSAEVRVAAVQLVRDGALPRHAARRSGVDPTTLCAWLHHDAPTLVRGIPRRCWRCHPDVELAAAPYAHLLGLYLGDGWVTRVRTTSFLSVACDDAWPGLADECEEAMLAVLATSVCRVRRSGCHDLKAYSQHWPCLLPQHGPGKKQNRSIVLEPWQEQVVAEHPGRLLRGLFNSDGWRGHNVAVKRAPDGVVTRYRYTR